MKNSHQHWRALSLNIPVDGAKDPWIAGRNWAQISADLKKLLPRNSGVQGAINGQTTLADGSILELQGHFEYENLVLAVQAFRDIWTRADFPNRTRLTHVERFRDCSFKHHVMIRWINGKMEPYSAELTDAVLLGPHNG